MPARDQLHATVLRALEGDGWTITDDPLRLQIGRRTMYVDLGAEQMIGAARGATRIAVEIKSFAGPSEIFDLEQALGQFVLYERALRVTQPDRTLWLAIPARVYRGLFAEAVGELLLADNALRLLVIDTQQEAIDRWIPSTPGATPSNAS